ncbi:MAG: hypothetical protein HY563_06295 [Ignavibacteriales bacterium]|nr:hypothetical protein [Ignavibacteriales bacterium]
MGIEHFTSDPDLLDQFIRLGHELYRDDPQWIPPFRKNLLYQFSSPSPFSRQPGTLYRNFIALQDRKVVGRISAFVNPQLLNPDGKAAGTIGFFECVNDYSVARDLLDASTRWLKEEGGRSVVWGPMNYDIWHGYRMMIHGFDQKTFCGEPYNKPWYPEFFERFGFTTRQTWDSVDIIGRESFEKVMRRGAERLNQVSQHGYRFVPFDMLKYDSEVRNLYDLLCQSFASFLGYTPTGFSEFRRIFGPHRLAIDPALFVFARDECDRLAGFAGSFLDISDGVRTMRGSDSLLARWRFYRRRKCTNRIIFYLGGVTPQEAIRKAGLGRAAFYHVLQQALNRGHEHVVVALMAQGNIVRGILNGMMAQAQRRYALYELNVH